VLLWGTDLDVSTRPIDIAMHHSPKANTGVLKCPD
jgi:hypothetical protein